MIITVTNIKNKNRGFLFGSCDDYKGEDILIPSKAHLGLKEDFHKLKNGSIIEGRIEKDKYGRLRIERYRIVSK